MTPDLEYAAIESEITPRNPVKALFDAVDEILEEIADTTDLDSNDKSTSGRVSSMSAESLRMALAAARRAYA